MRKMTRLLAILFCIPWLCSLLLPMEGAGRISTRLVSTAGFDVLVKDEKGVYCYDPEELLPCIMAAMLQEEEAEALCQAAAIICRTNLYYTWCREDKPDALWLSAAGMSCVDVQGFWQHEQRAALTAAAQATAGLVLTYEGEVIYAPYFYMSAGRTRTGPAPYLKSTECSDNLTNEQYLQQYAFPKAQFYAVLEELGGWKNIQSLSQLVPEKEESGYVTAIRALGETAYISAERLCERLSLPSLCFAWDEGEESVYIRTKGIGHGWGFDVCYGAQLAAQGRSCQDILFYFYDGILLEKVY